MKEDFDRFAVNIGESVGFIERKPFRFDYSLVEVWHQGQCVYRTERPSTIKAELIDQKLNVNLNLTDAELKNHIKDNVQFGEISTSGDRLLWSKDIFNSGDTVVPYEPDLSSLFFKDGVLKKVTYTIHNPNTLVEFYLNEEKGMSEIDLKCQKCIEKYISEDYSESRRLMVDVFRTIKFRTEALKDVTNYENLGKTLLLMLDLQISDDIDNQQMIASVGYLYLTKALKQSPGNLNILKDRLLILRMGHEPLKYTVMTALDLNAGGFAMAFMNNSDLKARDSIYKMEIADIFLNPTLYMKVDFFRERKNEFDQKISDEFFRPQITTEQVIDEGTRIHGEMFKYLENRVINELDVDF